MANGDQQHRPHLFPQDTRTTEGYTARAAGGGGRVVVPAQNRQQHAGVLRAQIAQVAAVQQQRVAEQQVANVQTAIGVQVEFESHARCRALAAESLARDRQWHRAHERAPTGRPGAGHRLRTSWASWRTSRSLLADYIDHERQRPPRPAPRQPVAWSTPIRAVRVATFESIWTDDPADALPHRRRRSHLVGSLAARRRRTAFRPSPTFVRVAGTGRPARDPRARHCTSPSAQSSCSTAPARSSCSRRSS
jgi:hypothetical protein